MHRISKRTHIRVRLSPILGIGNFCYAVLTETKKFTTNAQKLETVLNGSKLYAKNAVPYKCWIFENVLECLISMFVLPLNTASRKRVNSRGKPPK